MTSSNAVASSVFLPSGFHWDSDFALGPESEALASRVWPVFLSSASDRPQPGLELEISENEFRARYPAWGIRETRSGRLSGYANAVFIECDFSKNHLPEEGWQYAIESGVKNTRPNCLCLVIANVDPADRGHGLSNGLIDYAKALAKSQGLTALIAPVRPSSKSQHPEMSIDDYVHWRREDNSLYDPWLRAHERAGGVMLNVCHRSAIIEASIGLWERWTNKPYSQTGTYRLAEGLASLSIDIQTDTGIYIEPNVWFRYNLGP